MNKYDKIKWIIAIAAFFAISFVCADKMKVDEGGVGDHTLFENYISDRAMKSASILVA